MKLEDFKDLYASASTELKLNLLSQTLTRQGDYRVASAQTENDNDREYYRNEAAEQGQRARWLLGRLLEELSDKDTSGCYKYKKPEKEQLFKEIWSSKSTQGMVYIQDVRHAIGNSDQYPYPLFIRRGGDGQRVQDETLNAVIAAIDRVPIYEEHVDADCISREELMIYIYNKTMKDPEYTVSDVRRDIGRFQINRKRKEWE